MKKKLFARAWSDERGLAAIELALVTAVILVPLFIGATEIGRRAGGEPVIRDERRQERRVREPPEAIAYQDRAKSGESRMQDRLPARRQEAVVFHTRWRPFRVRCQATSGHP